MAPGQHPLIPLQGRAQVEGLPKLDHGCEEDWDGLKCVLEVNFGWKKGMT